MSYESISKRSVPGHLIVLWLSKPDNETYFRILGSAPAIGTGMVTSLHDYQRFELAMMGGVSLLVMTQFSLQEYTSAPWKERTQRLFLFPTIYFGEMMLANAFSRHMAEALILTPGSSLHANEWESLRFRVYWSMSFALINMTMLTLNAFGLKRKSLARKTL